MDYSKESSLMKEIKFSKTINLRNSGIEGDYEDNVYSYSHKTQIFDLYSIKNKEIHLACPGKDSSIFIFLFDEVNEKAYELYNFKHHYMYITNIKHHYSINNEKNILVTSSRDSRFITYDCDDKYKILNKINNFSSIRFIKVHLGKDNWTFSDIEKENNKSNQLQVVKNNTEIDIISVSTWIVLVPIKQYNLITGEKIREIDCNSCMYFDFLFNIDTSELTYFKEKSNNNSTDLLLYSSTPADLVILDINKTVNNDKDDFLIRYNQETSDCLYNKDNLKDNFDIIEKIISSDSYFNYYESIEITDPYNYIDIKNREMDKKNFNIRLHPKEDISNVIISNTEVKKNNILTPISNFNPNYKNDFRIIKNYNTHNNPLITVNNFINRYEIARIKTESIIEKYTYVLNKETCTDNISYIIIAERKGTISKFSLKDLALIKKIENNSYCYDMINISDLSFMISFNNKLFLINHYLELIKEYKLDEYKSFIYNKENDDTAIVCLLNYKNVQENKFAYYNNSSSNMIQTIKSNHYVLGFSINNTLVKLDIR